MKCDKHESNKVTKPQKTLKKKKWGHRVRSQKKF